MRVYVRAYVRACACVEWDGMGFIGMKLNIIYAKSIVKLVKCVSLPNSVGR